MKRYGVILIIALLIAGALAVRFFSGPEDVWICSDGQWVAHGSPSVPQPSEPCGQSSASPSPASTRTVQLYYYDADRDKDAAGNILCSRQGLVPVMRQIPLTTTPIQDAVRLLLKGELTAAERASGITTEFPLAGVSLTSASLKDGSLTLTFDDPQNRTGGGSCRVSILWAQIEATAKQFAGVTGVSFFPDTLFQP